MDSRVSNPLEEPAVDLGDPRRRTAPEPLGFGDRFWLEVSRVEDYASERVCVPAIGALLLGRPIAAPDRSVGDRARAHRRYPSAVAEGAREGRHWIRPGDTAPTHVADSDRRKVRDGRSTECEPCS